MVWIGASVLTAMPARQGCITITELVGVTGLKRVQISEAVARLADRGLCVRARKGDSRGLRASCYRRTPAGDIAIAAGTNLKTGPSKPVGSRDPGLRGRVWRALRILGKGTAIELVELAGRSGEPTELDQARKYLRHLVAEGIVKKLPRKMPGTHAQSRGHVQWLLLADRGPKPPTGPT